MTGLGTIVNVASILIGGVAGLALKKFLSQRLIDTILQGLGLAVVVIGLSGALSSSFTVSDGEVSVRYTFIMIISLAIGAFIGELIRIEKGLNSFAKRCENKFSSQGESSNFAQGFVTATLLFCVGSMSILGALEDGIGGKTDILFAKSTLDAISSMIFASTMGAGVLFSAIAVGVYQGLITLLAVFISPYLDNQVIAQMSVIGSVLIIGLGLNMLKITKIKVGNLLPAIFIPVIYYIIRCFV